MRLVVLEEIPEDPELRSAWNRLALSVERPEVFYTFEWSMAVQRAYGATRHPLVFLAYDEMGCLCGVVALATGTDGERASFLCATTGDYCDFLSLADDRNAFVQAVLTELRKRKLGSVTLTNLPADSATVAALRRATAHSGYHFFARTAYICAQVSLSKLERRAGENKPVLPGKKNLRRALSAMGQQGPVRLDHARSWDAARPILPQFALAHVARFLATGRISNLARPERRVFLDQLAKLLSESGWLALTRMMSGDKSYAWNYGFRFRDTWFWYQPTFDSDWERHSPGFCLLAKVIEEAADDPALSTVDLGLGAEEYKDRFANDSRETLYVTLRVSMAQHMREIVHYRAAEIIKTSPRLETSVRRVVGRLGELRDRAGREGVACMVRQLAKLVSRFFWSAEEMVFFEWMGSIPAGSRSEGLKSLNWMQLASATLQYVDDNATLAYLLRSASRLREKKSEGFAYADSEGFFLSFAWVTDFEGAFVKELGALKAKAPSSNSVLLFDGCSPEAARGGDVVYEQMMALSAERMREKGKKTWAFAWAKDSCSLQRLEKAGFKKRYSLVHRRRLGWQTISGETPMYDESRAAEVTART